MSKKLRITMVRSMIGSQQRQKATLQALGLRKRNQTVVQPDNEAIRGMIFKVNHLVEVEEVEE